MVGHSLTIPCNEYFRERKVLGQVCRWRWFVGSPAGLHALCGFLLHLLIVFVAVSAAPFLQFIILLFLAQEKQCY